MSQQKPSNQTMALILGYLTLYNGVSERKRLSARPRISHAFPEI